MRRISTDNQAVVASCTMGAMCRRPLVFAMFILFGSACGAEVIRCADAAGNVSYTDGACPAGARAVSRVALPDALPPASAPVPAVADRPRSTRREPAEAAARPPPAPSGPAVIDARGNAAGSGTEPAADSRWSDRGTDPVFIDDGYGYGYPGTNRPPGPPRDMRPRIRNCDAGGCDDRQSNRYNRSGQLERYQGIDGRTCTPVGTTTVCR